MRRDKHKKIKDTLWKYRVIWSPLSRTGSFADTLSLSAVFSSATLCGDMVFLMSLFTCFFIPEIECCVREEGKRRERRRGVEEGQGEQGERGRREE